MRAKKISPPRSSRAQNLRRAKTRERIKEAASVKSKSASRAKPLVHDARVQSTPAPALPAVSLGQPRSQPLAIYADAPVIQIQSPVAQLPVAQSPVAQTPVAPGNGRVGFRKPSRVVALVAVGVTAAAIAIAARQQPFPPAGVESADVQIPPEPPEPVAPISDRIHLTEPADVAPEPKPAVAPKPPTAVAPPKAAGEVAPVAMMPVEPVKIPAAGLAEKVAEGPTEAAAPKSDAEPSAVTITGCLAVDEETVRLRDTAGADAPKSRSWRSGFLKKRPAAIELVDTSHSLDLSTYAGQRVAATGTLQERTMRVRSLHRVTASCN